MPKSQAEINAWIREHQERLGIASENSEAKCSTVTVLLPSMSAVTRVAHAAADAKIAADPRYDEMCAWLDAELGEILEGGVDLTHPRAARNLRVPNACLWTTDDAQFFAPVIAGANP